MTAVTNGASFLAPVSPGSIFTIFGHNLASAEASATVTPLPTTLASTSVTVNGLTAPLYYVSPLQVNAQMPVELQPGEATVVVKSGDLISGSFKINVLPAAPGIFLYNNRAVVQNEDGQLNDSAHPAQIGKYIVAYLTGVGLLDNPIQTGSPTPLEPLSRCTAPFSATIGGYRYPAEVHFLGMTPNFVGLAQANIKVPNLPPGEHKLKITIDGIESNAAVITVR